MVNVGARIEVAHIGNQPRNQLTRMISWCCRESTEIITEVYDKLRNDTLLFAYWSLIILCLCICVWATFQLLTILGFHVLKYLVIITVFAFSLWYQWNRKGELVEEIEKSDNGKLIQTHQVKDLSKGKQYNEKMASEILFELGQNFNVCAVMEIKNYSKRNLVVECVGMWSGHAPGGKDTDTIGMPNINSRYSDVMSMRKTAGCSTGTVGVAIWKIEGTSKRLYVMWSVPYNQDHHANWLAIMISHRKDIRDKVTGDYDSRLAYDMYYGKYSDQAVLKDFYGDLEPIVYEKDIEYIVKGTMTKNHRCFIGIDFDGVDGMDRKTRKKSL